MARNVVEEILKKSFCLLKTYTSILCANFCDNDVQKIKKIQHEVEKKFNYINTEKKDTKVLKDKELFIEPVLTIIDSQMEPGHVRGQPLVFEKKLSIASMPLKEIYKKVLQTKRVYNKVEFLLDSLKQLHSKISNFMQGNLWKKKLLQLPPENGIVCLPFILYFDDWEPNNPLGSE